MEAQGLILLSEPQIQPSELAITIVKVQLYKTMGESSFDTKELCIIQMVNYGVS